MTSTASSETSEKLVGHNRISTRALESTARFAASESLGIDPEELKANVGDDGGNLALSLFLPVLVTSLNRQPDTQQPNAWQRLNAVKAQVAERVSELTGSQVGRVDIRVTGAQISEGARIQ